MRAKEIRQLNHDRPNLRQPGKGVSHQPPVLLLSKVEDGTIIQSESFNLFIVYGR